MKRMLAAGFVTAIAVVGSAGAASAAPAAAGESASCFGQVHKRVNTGDLGVALNLDNVGQLVKAQGGQGKNAIAMSVCS